MGRKSKSPQPGSDKLDGERKLFPKDTYTGKIHWQDNALEIQFTMCCEIDGTVVVESESIPVEDGFWLHYLSNSKSWKAEHFALEGQSSDGKRIKSDHVFIKNITTGDSITFTATCAELKVAFKPKDKDDTEIPSRQMLDYHLIGFECHGVLSGSCDLGQIRITGKTGVKNYDEVTGKLRITAPETMVISLEEWMDQCDSLVRSILDILSLANGRFINWTCRGVGRGNRFSELEFIGSRKGGKPSNGLFSYLHLQPVLEFALNNYTDELKKITGINVAIEWFLIKTPYKETQYMTAMTALEHMIHSFVNNSDAGTLFPKQVFKKHISPILKNALQSGVEKVKSKLPASFDEHALSERLCAAVEKISEMNRRSFKNNLRLFLEEKHVPLDKIKYDDIDKLILIRNRIVHRGIYKADDSEESLTYYLVLIQELIKRIFLTLLRFRGSYWSFLNGAEWKDFPFKKDE